jgi:hypothetical protein
MKNGFSMQLLVAIGIVVLGGGSLGLEYFLVKWYPRHQLQVSEQTLKLLSYQNEGLGIEMQLAAGIYGKVESFSGGVRIYRPRLLGTGPSLTITSQPNPDHTWEFSPQVLAIWETDGVTKGIPRYHFEKTTINNRDAVILQQSRDRTMVMTARIISADRIVEAVCSVGGGDEALFLQACDESVRTLKLAGPEPPVKVPQGIEEVPGVLH